MNNRSPFKGQNDVEIYRKYRKLNSNQQKSLLNFPDEIIEHILAFLSFNDLYNVGKVEKRLEDCAKRVLEKKPPFSKFIFDTIKLSCDSLRC